MLSFSPNKKQLLIFVASLTFILGGCFGQKAPEEKMYEAMEKTVTAEKLFEEQQDPLVALETKEKELFDKMMGLGLKEYKQLEKLSDEALALSEQRKEHIGKERKSLLDSQKEFEKTSELKDEIKEPKLKKKADLLYKTMEERYSAHETLYKDYMKALEGDQKLYTSLKDKNITIEELESQVAALNESYNKVLAANKKFNELTEKYNKEKLSFYEMAGLDGKES